MSTPTQPRGGLGARPYRPQISRRPPAATPGTWVNSGAAPGPERRSRPSADHMIGSSGTRPTGRATDDAPHTNIRDDAFMTSHEPSGKFWFCMEHHRVEKSEATHSTDHLGPFPTEDAAAHALETVAEREKAYDAEDSAWNGDD